MPKCISCGKFYLFNIDRILSICNKCKIEKKNCIDSNSPKPITQSFINGNIEPYIPDPFANIPEDVIALLWFLDGTRKNFIPKSYNFSKIIKDKTIKFSFSSSLDVEPSAISLAHPIMIDMELDKNESIGYFPSYSTISPEQRNIYLSYLKDIYNPSYNIGYVFIFYYGLERHLFQGDFDNAFHTILKLRAVHKNKSFQQYSLNSLFLNSIIKKRFDLLPTLLLSLKDDAFYLKVNLFVFYKSLTQSTFSAQELIYYARKFGFANTQFIKKHYATFEQELTLELNKNALTPPLGVLPYEEICLYANNSIPLTIKIPDYISIESFKLTGKALLQNAYEKTKIQIKNKEKN